MRKIFTKLLIVVFAVSLLAGCATKSSYYRLDPSLAYSVKNINGFQYVPLVKACDAYGMNCSWDAVANTATITGRSGTIVLRAGSDTVLSGGSARKIDRPVVLSGGTVFVPVSFVRQTFMPATASVVTTAPVVPVPEAAASKKFTINTIVLDTGHGGKDVGAVGSAYGTKEKNLALVLSGKIKAILESNGIRVIMTRSADNFVSLERRADIANKSNADIFVSVHINASRSRAMRGFECYYLSNATDDTSRALQAFEDSSLKLSDSADAMRSSQLDKTLWDMSLTENRRESGELAGYICSSVEDSLAIKNRGVKTARFYVLKNTNIPSVLVEAGYLSNRIEELQLKNPAVLDRLAEAIARGILQYRKRYEATEGFTSV